MKKIINYSLIIVLSITLFSCGKEKKQEETPATETSYSIDAENSSVQWTGYKTTDKVAVNGTFEEISILNMNSGSTAAASLEGLEFEIPVSSIYSKDTIRDGKLKRLFFGVMENTLSLKGKFSVKDASNGQIAISMNGLTKELPFTYGMSKDTILINATMDLNIWETQNALASIHEACLELHTGADGVSKTWDEVGITAKILTVKN
ncbi:YceI family protein [Lutimonas halocynthiae]|uniref:YceI family protein n=1 Tax=Lutimonas halocynthiae TaxID=1446477 RepID=UPI0025B440B6|nr:YceI family protein [Lutimonas halocynthiae]MDN3644476.1 YceI family protein [Lutimonas halocynthiae]